MTADLGQGRTPRIPLRGHLRGSDKSAESRPLISAIHTINHGFLRGARPCGVLHLCIGTFIQDSRTRRWLRDTRGESPSGVELPSEPQGQVPGFCRNGAIRAEQKTTEVSGGTNRES